MIFFIFSELRTELSLVFGRQAKISQLSGFPLRQSFTLTHASLTVQFRATSATTGLRFRYEATPPPPRSSALIEHGSHMKAWFSVGGTVWEG